MPPRPRSITLTCVLAAGILVFLAGAAAALLDFDHKAPTDLSFPDGISVQTTSVAIVAMVLGVVLILGTLIAIAKTPGGAIPYGRPAGGSDATAHEDSIADITPRSRHDESGR